MPTALHPQASFDPIPPDLDLRSLVDGTKRLKWAQRVSRAEIQNLRQEDFEKLILIHVVLGGKPLVIDGWDDVLPSSLFHPHWLENNYNKKQESVRDLGAGADVPMTIGHYLRSMQQLTDQWTRDNFRDENRQRLYLKDIDCPKEWHESLQTMINPCLFYLNNNVTMFDEKASDGSGLTEFTGAAAGDLMSNLPQQMRAENLMCYIGHEGTYTPAHREMCASLGQNIMVEASGNENGEKPGSSIWFMTETKDRSVVREYFLSMLGHDIEIEKHFAQINAWKRANFDVHVVEQKPGDFILIPPLAAHQVWNRGTRTMKVAWNRSTPQTLEMALNEALPKARLVCRDEQYKNKAMIYYSLKEYDQKLQFIEESSTASQSNFFSIGRNTTGNSARTKSLVDDFGKLFQLFSTILADEIFMCKEKDIELIPFDSCITCSYCRANIFNRFLTCKHCIRLLDDGEEDTYDICMECYVMGRSCACISGLSWCEQWSWPTLVHSYDSWRDVLIMNTGFIDIETSPPPLEIARQRLGRKSLAQMCQEALKKRPFKDITAKVQEQILSDTESSDTDSKSKKKKKAKAKRKQKVGQDQRCHVCCHKDYNYKVHQCTNTDCLEAYCYGVLYRAFDMMPQDVIQDEHWQCPKCCGICNCGGCRRLGNTKPYCPKNTSLGHDTRHIADDRSVEALVDFRVHNLSWLKAAGEQSRSKDSKRMMRLEEEANQAKIGVQNNPDLVHQIDSIAIDSQHSEMELSIDNSNQNGHAEQIPMQENPLFGNGEEVSSNSMGTTRNPILNGEPMSRYPVPVEFSIHRIGLGYYDHADVVDRILFHPYQAQAEESDSIDEPNISQEARQAIKAARDRARKHDEDPEFLGPRSSRRQPTEQKAHDILDPALFEENTESHDGLVEGTDNFSKAGTSSLASGSSRQQFPANIPVLRHAKPTSTYIEMTDADIVEAGSDGDDVPVQATEQMATSVSKDRKRPRNPLQSNEPSSTRTSLGANEGLSERNVQKRKPGQPKKSSLPARANTPSLSVNLTLEKQPLGDEAEYEDIQDQEGVESAKGTDAETSKPRKRGRPSLKRRTSPDAGELATGLESRVYVGPPLTTLNKPSPIATKASNSNNTHPTKLQYMTMAERMAERGKAFKIGTRKPNQQSEGKEKKEKKGEVSVQIKKDSAAEMDSDSQSRVTTNPGLQSKISQATVVRIGDRESGQSSSPGPSTSSHSSDSDESDIPARLPVITPPKGGEQSSGRGRGRPRGRARTRARGAHH